MRLQVDGISHNGEGVARHNGKIVFIPYAIPGEIVEADIAIEKKRYSLGVLQDVLEKSPIRVEPKCPYYYQCGGCSYQHVDYGLQLDLKRMVVKESLKRIGGIVDTDVNQVAGMEEPWNYRNKVIWHLQDSPRGKKMGYYQRGSNTLVEVDECPLLLPGINEISRLIAAILTDIKTEKNSSITIQQSHNNGRIMISFINCSISDDVLKELSGRVNTIYEQERGEIRLLYGQPKLEEKAGQCLFRLRPGAFFQVNPEQTEKLLNYVSQYLDMQGKENLLDAYCGVGSFALNMAAKAASVTGVESFAPAIEDARENAVLNKIKNYEFIAGACEKLLPVLNRTFDKVIVDPPRAGLKPEVITAITGNHPQSIAYVSCNPATLARDLKTFTEQGYKIQQVQPVDMFPQTGHVETVTVIERK